MNFALDEDDATSKAECDCLVSFSSDELASVRFSGAENASVKIGIGTKTRIKSTLSGLIVV